MRVIQEAKDRSFRIDCPLCMSLLEYTYADVFSPDDFRVVCPVCNKVIFVKGTITEQVIEQTM